MLKRKKWLIWGGGGGIRKERMKSCHRIGRIAQDSWDGEDRGGDDCLSGFSSVYVCVWWGWGVGGREVKEGW